MSVSFKEDESEPENELEIIDADLQEEPLVIEGAKPCHPFKGLRLYYFTLKGVLGWRFFVFLLFSQMLGKGLLYQLTKGFVLPLFKSVLHVDATTLQIYTMIITLPWSIKPILGLASDFILLFGYHKRWWLILSAIIGTVCSCLLVTMRPTIESIIVILLTGINLQIALYDLLSEAKYSELRNKNPKVGSDITTLVNIMQTLGALGAIGIVGTLTDNGLYLVLYIITFVLCVSPIVPTVLGWLPEDHSPLEEGGGGCGRIIRFSITRLQLREELPLILVVGFCGCSGIISNVVVTFSPTIGLIVATLLLVMSLAGCWAVFPAGITQVALYQVLTTLSRPVLGGALDYFYTATPVCVADGPHFSYVYYISVAGVLGTVLGLAGALIYQLLFSKLKFRIVLLITTVLVVVGALSDLFIVTRTNIAWGIPDKTAYILGEAVLEPVLGMLAYIPVSTLIQMAVPKGKEASAYAFMAGITNYSGMVSELSGAVLFNLAGIVTNETAGCNFDALPTLIVMCYIILPLLVGIPAVFLIPNIYQTGTLAVEPTGLGPTG